MAMKVIAGLLSIGDAQFVSSTIAETVALWNAATPYALTAQVRKDTTHQIYECIIANTGVDPEADTNPPSWKAVGPTNRWAMLDTINQTVSTDNLEIEVVIEPGQFTTGLYLGGLKGAKAQVIITNGDGGPVVFDTGLMSLDRSQVNNWYDYWFAPFVQKTELTLTNLPPYKNARITVRVTGGGEVAIGTLAMGYVVTYGQMRMQPQGGRISYSRKDTDANTGITTFIKKPGAKRNQYAIWVDKSDARFVSDSLDDLDGELAVFIGTEDDELPMFTVFGFYRNLTYVLSSPKELLFDLELESVT